jgi:hypothetical protein
MYPPAGSYAIEVHARAPGDREGVSCVQVSRGCDVGGAEAPEVTAEITSREIARPTPAHAESGSDAEMWRLIAGVTFR